MVARSAPTLRFSSVRHRDPPPPALSDPRSKISAFAHGAPTTTTTTTSTKTTSKTSTITTRRNAIAQHQQQQKHQQLQSKLKPLKQSKLPFSLSPPPASATRPGPPSPQRQRQPTKTIAAHERPFKKAKLDGCHHDQASIVGPAKLPLRSRDSQGLLTPELTATSSAASRTRSATGGHTTAAANNSSKTNTLAAPPRPPLPSSPASGITRTTRKSAHSYQHHPPVAVSEDVEKVNRVTFGDNDSDNNKNNKIITAPFGIGGAGGVGVGDDAHNNSNRLKDGTSSSTVVGREKRSLRSNDGGSRSKSELAMYFQNYEQILSLEPVKPEFLSADTSILLIDDLTQPVILDPAPINAPAAKPRGKQDKRNLTNGHVAQLGMDNPLLELHDAQMLDLRLPANSSREPPKDPLDDDVYFKAHRRIERQEKQLRNIERERAQHEKVQLDRLLDELQGHDWLRVMGISGITETEKKLYEPKRAYFIKEVSALIEKFRAWKEEERRRKIERDQNLADEGDDEDEDEEDDNDKNETEDENEEGDEDEVEDQDEAEEAVDQSSIKEEDTGPQPDGELESLSPNFQTYGEPPDINDVDAWAARQLHQEAISASSNTASYSNPLPKHVSISSSSIPSPTSTSTSYPAPAGRDSDRAARAPSPATTTTSAQAPTPPPQPEAQPFTSFYTKRHLRDAAVGKIRRGRTRTAFGQPLPEVVEREFQLPRDILTEEAIDVCQRKKRRLRRERKA